MNIEIQCCGVALLIMLLIIYSKQRRLDLASGKLFLAAYFTTMFCLCMDILSVVLIVHRARIPWFLTEFVCKTYLVSLVLVGLLALSYVGSDICCQMPAYRKQMRCYVLITIAVGALIYGLPISLYSNADGSIVYSYGPSTWMTYAGALFFIGANLATLVTQRKRIHDRQRRAVITWMGMWIAAALIQFLNSQLLVVGFACALGISVIFFQFENPELHLDRNTGLFNYIAYNRYTEQMYSKNKDFFVIAVLLENAFQRGARLKNSLELASRAADIFLRVPGASSFKTMEDEMVLIFRDRAEAQSAWEFFQKKLPEQIEKYESLQCLPTLYFINNVRCVNTGRELLDLVHYVRSQKKDSITNYFQFVEDLVAEQMFSEKAMTQEIRDALAEDRVEVYYQPIYSIDEQRFTSAEALVRILDRDGKLIPPLQFVSIAEGNGMIIDVGKRVFEKVCDFFVGNSLEKLGIEYIEVNLSVVQCADESLADDYVEIMKRFRLDPSRINLEITESASMRAKKILIDNMQKMMDYGIRFSLDDFGTGHSNLNYIVDMPVRIVKFDREMIQAYFTNEKARYVMDAAMHMIQGMGLKIVAEGIETEEQFRVMEDIRINYIQGFYFSQPLPEQEFYRFIEQENFR